jgi:uncharacterized membrane protein
LAEMEEVRGYTLGETTRDFYDAEGQREDMATIKGWIIEDALTALDLNDDISLGALIGKSITVEVIGLDGRVDFTDEYTFEFIAEPEASTYDFSYEVPVGIVAGEEVAVDVTFATVEEGDYGYDGVRFAYEVTSAPEGATVTFTSADEQVKDLVLGQGEKGYWGPGDGFSIPADYEATTGWKLTFSAAGNYTIAFSLIDAETEELIADITASEELEVLEAITEEEREQAKDYLAAAVAAKVDELTDIDEVEVAFDEESRKTTITILDEEGTILDLSGTGAMVLLAEMEEVRGYTLGETTRDFYDAEGQREDMATIKGWIIEDALTALDLNDDISLGALIGKSITVEVIGLDGRVDFTDEYTFEFIAEPEASTYDFSYEVPVGIVAGEEVAVDVTFATVEEGDYGYDGVRFAYEVTSAPEGATVTFTSADEQVKDLVLGQGEKGYWGPGDGFSIPADYEATTGWKLTFSAAGNYTIAFSLIDAETEELIADITASEELEVLEAITEEEREQAKDYLAAAVAAKVDELTDIDEVEVAFDEESRKTTITILDEEGTILDLSGTGAMVLLAEMEEVRGYTLGETTRDFYDAEGQREDMATIKGWIIEDALTALDLNDDISLGALIGKSITVEVIGLDGRVDFTDEYTFEFIAEPEASTYDFSYEVPVGIVAGEEVAVDVTFATVEEGDYGYDGVRFAYEVTSAPEGATVTFTSADEQVKDLVLGQGEKGYWGPGDGFSIPADYEATTGWKLTFSAAGNYTIAFSLIDAETEELIADITASEELEVLEAITEEEREQAKDYLAAAVAAKVDELTDIDEVEVAFDEESRKTTITILDEEGTILDLSGTGAMVLLAEMEEVRGYTLGETTRDFYDAEGQREDMATIKGWIIEDALTALDLNDDISLGALIGKSITVEVIGLDGRVDFTDEYTFEFIAEPEASTYDFSYEVPVGIVAGEEVAVDVTFATVEEGDYGYDGVRFAYEVTSAPEGATVTFTSADEQVKDLVLGQGEKGYWGPETGLAFLRTMKQPPAGN